MVHYDTYLENATDIITKRDRYFITKCDKRLLEWVSGFLLQNPTVSLQNVIFITKCNDFITKCDLQKRRLLQNAIVQC